MPPSFVAGYRAGDGSESRERAGTANGLGSSQLYSSLVLSATILPYPLLLPLSLSQSTLQNHPTAVQWLDCVRFVH